jgi:hypothetical protein
VVPIARAAAVASACGAQTLVEAQRPADALEASASQASASAPTDAISLLILGCRWVPV